MSAGADADAGESEGELAAWRGRSVGRRTRWRWGIAVLVVLTGLVTMLRKIPAVAGWERGETDWRGDRVHHPRHPAALAEVDLVRVHAELLPRWLIARSHRTRGEGAPGAEAEAFQRLREAVAADANLVELAEQWRAVAPPETLAEQPRRALYLAWAWSHYLDQQGAPFLVHGTVQGTSFGPMLSATVYEVHADAAIGLGAGAHRVRLVSRIDRLNLREAYLGAAGHDDAVVVIDRLREFAMADVWPLFDPWVELPAARSTFAEAIRREGRAELSEAAWLRLRDSAGARWEITRTLRAIEARRASCNSRFRINEVPWDGFSVERLGRLEEIAQRHAQRRCPGITEGEVEALRHGTAGLVADPELRAALEELVAWTAQHVAVHEARHLGDAALADGFDRPLPCVSCSEEMGVAARAELSGYLASLAWSPSPALALYQACRSLAGEHRHITPHGQPHRSALELLQRRMGPVCLDGPPPELRALGRHLEVEMLGRSEPMALPTDFVRTLPVE